MVAACNLTTSETIKPETVMVNGHNVQRYVTDTWVCYFMRIPDGNIDGSGFDSTGHFSVQKLRRGTIPRLQTVEKPTPSAVYEGWQSFVNTLRGIFDLERLGTTTTHPWVNASDYDPKRDPNGHSDHYVTGDALQQFVRSDYNRFWWLSYCTDRMDPNLPPSSPDYQHKYHLYWDGYVAMLKKIMNGKPFPQPFKDEWAAWGSKCYGNEEKIG
jgi:hypothetical protein